MKMKTIFLIAFAAFTICSCKAQSDKTVVRDTTRNEVTEPIKLNPSLPPYRRPPKEMFSPSTLIILYDASVGKKPLLKAVKKLKAEVIYDYKMINGIAIRIADGTDIEETRRQLMKVKGVVRVNRDRVMQLM